MVVSVGEKKRQLSKGEFVLSMAWTDGEQEFAHDRTDSLGLLEAAGVDKMAEKALTLGSWRAALRAGI